LNQYEPEGAIYTPYWINHGLYAISNLDPDLVVVGSWTSYYENLINSLQV
jgi:hypothetical protein